MDNQAIDTQGLVTLCSIFIPLLTGFVVSKAAASWEKQLISVFFNAVLVTLVLVLQADFHVNFWIVVVTFVNSLVTSLASYNAWKKTGVTAAIQVAVPQGLTTGKFPTLGSSSTTVAPETVVVNATPVTPEAAAQATTGDDVAVAVNPTQPTDGSQSA